MYFENRFPESGSGQILHSVRAGQNILDLIRRPRIATIFLCVDRAATVTVQTSNHDTLSRKLRAIFEEWDSQPEKESETG